MPSGILEVLLVHAKGLSEKDSWGKMDPYVVIQYKSNERRSKIASGQGKNPVWNEKFTFQVQYPGSNDQYKLNLRIMDKDIFSADDFVGEATIYLKDLLASGVENGKAELRPSPHRVILADGTYRGQIQVGVIFNLKIEEDENVEEFGGWKHSS